MVILFVFAVWILVSPDDHHNLVQKNLDEQQSNHWILDKIEKDLNELYSSLVVVGKDDQLIVLSESEDLMPIKQFINNQYNFNKTYIKVKHIEKIPLNASGKTNYKLLTEKYC